MTPENIRELAEEIAEALADSRNTIHPKLDIIAMVLHKHFPPEQPVEGSVLVRIAVSRGFDKKGKEIVSAEGIDGYASEDDAVCNVQFDDDTHFGIIEAWLPPIQPIPTVPGTVEPKGGSDVN